MGLDEIEKIVLMAVNYGFPLILVIYYIAIELPRSRKYNQKLIEKLTTGIKKELNVDDLIVEIKELNKELRDSNERSLGYLGIINDAIMTININTNETRKEFKECLKSNNEELKIKLELILKILENNKELTAEEMYMYIVIRFSLSIFEIVDFYIEIVEKNNLFYTKTNIFEEMSDDISRFVNKGRNFIYTRNFDNRILDRVFDNTDESIEFAVKALQSAFSKFYNIGEKNVKNEDYAILKRDIRAIGKKITLNSDKMLKKIVLEV